MFNIIQMLRQKINSCQKVAEKVTSPTESSSDWDQTAHPGGTEIRQEATFKHEADGP